MPLRKNPMKLVLGTVLGTLEEQEGQRGCPEGPSAPSEGKKMTQREQLSANLTSTISRNVSNGQDEQGPEGCARLKHQAHRKETCGIRAERDTPLEGWEKAILTLSEDTGDQ